MTFAAHNVFLPDGTQTLPGFALVADSDAFQTGLFVLNQAFSAVKDRSQVKVADLGCLEGGYAYEFAKQGYDVTGIEARRENYLNARSLVTKTGWDNLRFIRGDVRDELAGLEFDAVFCSGVLYHMDQPVSFLKQLGEVTKKLLILNTHFSLQGGHDENVHHAGDWCEYGNFQHEGRRGHWYHETVDDRFASYGNRKSFWLEKDELFASLCEDAGFGMVFEIVWQSARKNHIPGGAGRYGDRGMFAAFKSLERP